MRGRGKSLNREEAWREECDEFRTKMRQFCDTFSPFFSYDAAGNFIQERIRCRYGKPFLSTKEKGMV